MDSAPALIPLEPPLSPAAALDPPPEDKALHRKIARLPKPLRDSINSMLDDCLPYCQIVATLRASTDPPLPYPITETDLSRWKNGRYLRYLAQQDRLAMVQANREGAAGLVTTDDLTPLPEATLQIIANQYYEFLGDFSPETLRQKLSEDPLKYTRFLNVFARLAREIVHLRKFRDASAKNAAAKLKHLDQDRDLSDNEFDAIVGKWDKAFKVARPRKTGGANVSASPVAKPESSAVPAPNSELGTPSPFSPLPPVKATV